MRTDEDASFRWVTNSTIAQRDQAAPSDRIATRLSAEATSSSRTRCP